MTDAVAEVTDETINVDSIQADLEEFFEEEEIITQSISEDVVDLPFRISNIPIADYCSLEETSSMQIVEVDVDPAPPENQVLLGIKDYIGGVGTASRLFLANKGLIIPHMQGSTPVIKIRNANDKLMNSGFEIHEMSEQIDGERFIMFCYVPYMTGKKIFGFGKTTEFFYEQRFFSVGTCKEDEVLPSFEMPSLTFRSKTDTIGNTDKIICSNTSARFRKMSTIWRDINEATEELNEMLLATIDPNYMEKIMRLNMFFTVPNAHING